MSESGMTLEKLRVVIEATTKPFRDEMRKLRASLREENKAFVEQKEALKKSMEEQRKPIRKLKEELQGLSAVKIGGASGKDLQKSIAAAERELKKLIERREDLEASGGDIELTKEFRDMEMAAEQAEKKLNSLIERRERLKSTGGKMGGASGKRLDYDIEQAENSLKYARADLENATTGEKFQNTTKWEELNRKIGKCRTTLAQYHAQEQELERGTVVTRSVKRFQGLLAALKKVTGVIKKSSGAFATLIQKFRNGIPHINRTRNAMSGMGNSGRGLGGMFKTIGMTARFMFASFLLQGVLQGAGEGFKNLAGYSSSVNENLSILSGGLVSLKNAFAAAFAPILDVVTPYLDTLITYLINAANALGQFFAALTGKSTYTKATKVQKDFAASTGKSTKAVKELKRELFGFDEITRQSDTSSGAGGGGGTGGGLSPGDMFTEETVNNQFADFAKLIKDAWGKADFTEIGEIVGNKLNHALENIPWDKIKGTTEKIAKSVATFLNGFIKTTDWKLVGGTIAEGINTAVLGAHTFLVTFDWRQLGQSVADFANGAIGTADFGMIGQTVGEALGAAIDTWHEFVTTFNFSQLGEKIGNSISGFFTSMGKTRKSGMNGWQELGNSISGTISGIARSLTTALKTVPWESVGQAIADFIGAIEWEKIVWNLGELSLSFWEALEKAIKGNLDRNRERMKEAIEALDIGGIIRQIIIDAFNPLEWINSLSGGLIGGSSLPDDYEEHWNDDEYWEKQRENDRELLKKRLKKAAESGKIPAIEVPVKSATNGVDIVKGVQKQIGNTNLETGMKTTNSGYDIYNQAQAGFESQSFKNRMDMTNSGYDIYNMSQSQFAFNPLRNKMTTTNNGYDIYNQAQWAFQGAPFMTGMSTTNSGYDLKNIAQSQFSASSLYTSAACTPGSELFGMAERQWNNSKRTLMADAKINVASIHSGIQGVRMVLKADGGVYTGGSWKPVTAYAGGGTPNTGQMFIAREAGPELVGTIGGNTAVMNNNQIVSSVAAGVAGAIGPAVYNAVVTAMSRFGGGNASEINVYVEGKRITDVVIEEVNQRTKATGQPQFMF